MDSKRVPASVRNTTVAFLAVASIFAIGQGPASTINGDAERLREIDIALQEARVPVGSVIAFWGSITDVQNLDAYELCDGELVSTAGSPLFGKKKPDLRDRFVMGASGSPDLLASSMEGGSNSTGPIRLGSTGAVRLNIEQIPRHAHEHSHNTVVIGPQNCDHPLDERPRLSIMNAGDCGQDSKYALVGSNQSPNAGPTNVDRTTVGGERDQKDGRAAKHSHSIPDIEPWDSRPAYSALYYIVRVR